MAGMYVQQEALNAVNVAFNLSANIIESNKINMQLKNNLFILQ